MNNTMTWILVIIALVVGAFGGYIYANAKASSEMMMVKQSMQKQLDDAKMASDKAMKEQKTMRDEKAAMQPTGAMMKEGETATGNEKMMPAAK